MSSEGKIPELYILAACLTKAAIGTTAVKVMQGYRVATSEDEAKGSFITYVMAEAPGYSIADLLCMAVPDAAIRSLGDKT